ncbi:unnamed protein product, partial [Linum tenue]
MSNNKPFQWQRCRISRQKKKKKHGDQFWHLYPFRMTSIASEGASSDL